MSFQGVMPETAAQGTRRFRRLGERFSIHVHERSIQLEDVIVYNVGVW